MTIFNCRLCGEKIDDTNRCKAHIIPRSILKIFSPKEYGQLFTVGTNRPKKRAPIGTYDQNILCRTCDNNLGQYDDYVAQFIKRALLIEHPSGVAWTIDGFDQKKLKLFFISYLWRCSITNQEEFSGVRLGDKHENRIRQTLLNNGSTDIDDYIVVMSKFENTEDYAYALLTPAKTRLNGIAYYQCYLPKLYQFWIKVDSRPDPLMQANSLGSSDNILVYNKGDFTTSTEKKIMIEAVRYNKRH